MSDACGDPWLVLRTRSRHEGVVENVLQQKQIVAYLPRRKVVRAAPGSRRAVSQPLFPGYLFVRPRADQYAGMRYIRGSCGLVMTADKPAALPEKDLWTVRTLVDSDAVFTVEPEIAVGQRVRVVAGALAGVEGELVRSKNQDQLVVNLDLVSSSVRVVVARDAIAAV